MENIKRENSYIGHDRFLAIGKIIHPKSCEVLRIIHKNTQDFAVNTTRPLKEKNKDIWKHLRI
jgi:hypothetical protein